MRRRDFSWTIAFCASVAAHVAFIRWRADIYVRENESYRLPGFDRTELALAGTQVIDEADRLGDSHGTGYATDAAPGDLEQLAQKADEDQSFLSRDPQGPGQVGAPPSQSTAIPGQNGENGARTAKQSLTQPTPPQQAFGIQAAKAAQATPQFAKEKSNPDPAKVDPGQDSGPGPAQPTQVAAADPSQAQTPSRPQQPSPPTPTVVSAALAGRPGPDTPPADPAPQAETESDPFAIVGSLEFRQGSTTVRMGRKHRITRPRLSWDTQYDFFGMTRSTVVLDLQLDETGHVTSATIERSSGSESVDQPCRIAAYQWWFEPAKDAGGHPIRDEIKFTIKFL